MGGGAIATPPFRIQDVTVTVTLTLTLRLTGGERCSVIVIVIVIVTATVTVIVPSHSSHIDKITIRPAAGPLLRGALSRAHDDPVGAGGRAAGGLLRQSAPHQLLRRPRHRLAAERAQAAALPLSAVRIRGVRRLSHPRARSHAAHQSAGVSVFHEQGKPELCNSRADLRPERADVRADR